jgi:1-acyl-sn-glycerol-3-phosphate acyltransferase
MGDFHDKWIFLIFDYLGFMLYYIGYGLMWMTFRIFFRKISVVGKDKIQHLSSTIIIANHPASFLDAMVLAVFLGRPLHFYVRGDIFSHPLARWVLSQLHMIPIYSIEHGVHNLGKNKNTFERGQQLLRNGNMLLIFPEGFSRFSKELVPLKKGASRVALQTAFEDQFKQDLQIQTISINYSYHGFRSTLHIRIGDVMKLDMYRDSYLSQPNLAIANLNKDMASLFRKNVIHVKQGERTPHVESLIRISLENEYDGENYFIRSRNICDCVSELDENTFEHQENKLQEFEGLIKKYKLSYRVLSKSEQIIYPKLFLLLILFPFALIGFSLWHGIYFITKWVSDKTVTREDFYTSVFCGVLGVLGFIWWLTLIIVALSIHIPLIVFMVVVSPFIYMFSLRWLEETRNIFSGIRLKIMMRQDKSAYENLMNIRSMLECIK